MGCEISGDPGVSRLPAACDMPGKPGRNLRWIETSGRRGLTNSGKALTPWHIDRPDRGSAKGRAMIPIVPFAKHRAGSKWRDNYLKCGDTSSAYRTLIPETTASRPRALTLRCGGICVASETVSRNLELEEVSADDVGGPGAEGRNYAGLYRPAPVWPQDEPSLPMRKKLARALGVPVRELLE